VRSLFFGLFTFELIGHATIELAGYGFSAARASSAEPASHALISSLCRIAGMRCLAL